MVAIFPVHTPRTRFASARPFLFVKGAVGFCPFRHTRGAMRLVVGVAFVVVFEGLLGGV